MPAEANGDKLYIGRGKFYFDRYDPITLAPTGVRRFVGEVDKGEISISVTTKERFTTTKHTNNKIANVATQQKHTITLDLMEFTKDNVALALLGDSATFTQGVTPVTAEVLASTAYAIGDIYQLKSRNPTSLVLTSGVSTTLVLGTDYEIQDATLGLIRMLTGATAVLKAAYTPGSTGKARVTAGTSIQILGLLIFVGDPTNGDPFDLEVWKVNIAPAGALALLSDDFGTMSLSGEILEDPANHPTAPLYQLSYR